MKRALKENKMDDLKKAQARLKRESMELAGQIHDIVEENLWSGYEQLPELSARLTEKVREYEKARELYVQSQPQ